MSVTKKEENKRLTVGYEQHHRLLKRTAAMERELEKLRNERKHCQDSYVKHLTQGTAIALPASLLLALDQFLKSTPLQEVADDLQEVLHLAVAHGGAEYGLDENHVSNLDTVFKLQKLFRNGSLEQPRMAAA